MRRPAAAQAAKAAKNKRMRVDDVCLASSSGTAKAEPPPGSNTLNDLFAWPFKVGAVLREMPKFAHVMQKHMSAGLLVFSDHSGTGNGEHGILDALRAIDEGWAARAVVYSVCDYSEHAQKALRWTSDAKVIFSDFHEQTPNVLWDSVADMLPRAADKKQERLDKFDDLAKTLAQRAHEFFPPDRTMVDQRTGDTWSTSGLLALLA